MQEAEQLGLEEAQEPGGARGRQDGGRALHAFQQGHLAERLPDSQRAHLGAGMAGQQPFLSSLCWPYRRLLSFYVPLSPTFRVPNK